MNVYLDNAATTPLAEGCKEYLSGLLNEYGNPSSAYEMGQKARNIIESTRKDVKNFIGATNGCVYFTSSGSASNTAIIRGYCTAQKGHIDLLYSQTMHSSALLAIEALEASGLYDVTTHKIDFDEYGVIKVDRLCSILEGVKKSKNIIVISEYANSESGAIQPVDKIINIAHLYHAFVYLDCTGSIPTIPLNISQLKADAIGFSAHKLGGLKGTGVLWLSDEVKVSPLVYGEQEHGKFGGTENVLGIASLGYAVRNYQYRGDECQKIADDFIDLLIKFFDDWYPIGPFNSRHDMRRLPNNWYLCFPGVDTDALVILLDSRGIQISTGSACSTGHESRLLKLLGIPEKHRHSCLRVTFSGNETTEQINYAYHNLCECVELLRKGNEG